MLRGNRKKKYDSPSLSRNELTREERNDYILSETKKTDTTCYDTPERMKTDTDMYDRSEIKKAEDTSYDTTEMKKTDISVFPQKVASNGCIKKKCSRGIENILNESELPLKYPESMLYDRSCLSLPRLSEVMLGSSSSNSYGVIKRRELLMKTGQRSAMRITRSVTPRIDSNRKRIMSLDGYRTVLMS
jgi:hypothetical protein